LIVNSHNCRCRLSGQPAWFSARSGQIWSVIFGQKRPVITRIHNGDVVDHIDLKKLPRPFYSAGMPYDNGFEFMQEWVEEYYDIPHGQVKFIWEW